MESPIPTLTPSPRMPVLFIGHGSPMNVIEDNPFRPQWEALGKQFGTRWPRPQLILCISAHWLTHGWWMTGQERPRTIHDFGGFPDELFAQRYASPGAPAAAAAIARLLDPPGVGLDTREWGYDHGSWGVLLPMFPQADIPVLQLSLNWDLPPSDHLALGRKLQSLRDLGVLIVGSGNTVHNLRAMRRDMPAGEGYDWAIDFDQRVAQWLEQRDMASLANFTALGPLAQMAQPSYDHLLPLVYAAGASDEHDVPTFFNVSYQGGSIAMRSVVWDAPQATS